MSALQNKDDDDDLELALKLHRELNAPQRRSRHQQPPESRDALRKLADRRKPDQIIHSSDDSEDEGTAETPNGAAGKESRQRARHSSPEGSSGAARGISKRPLGKSRLGRPPGKAAKRRSQPLLPHEVAAAAAVQKAGRAGKEGGAPLTHFKCFVSGIPWGALLPAEAARGREALAEAVCKAFERDGFRCDADQLEVTVVTQHREKLHFPPQKAAEGGALGGTRGGADSGGGWSESMLREVARVYVSVAEQAAGA